MAARFFLLLALSAVIGCSGGFGVGCGLEPAPLPTTTTRAATTSAGSVARTVSVAANRGWQDTDISVDAGQKFRLRYRSGQITDKDARIADAQGSDYVCGDPGCCEPLPDERRSSLIARVAGDVFWVGNGGEFSSPSGGTVFLRVNDCDDGLFDNAGELSVEFIP